MKQSASFQGLNIDKNSIINLEKGKLPPQAIDLEEVVLGAMMIDKKGVDEVIDLLTAEAFYKETHQLIFQALLVSRLQQNAPRFLGLEAYGRITCMCHHRVEELKQCCLLL